MEKGDSFLQEEKEYCGKIRQALDNGNLSEARELIRKTLKLAYGSTSPTVWACRYYLQIDKGNVKTQLDMLVKDFVEQNEQYYVHRDRGTEIKDTFLLTAQDNRVLRGVYLKLKEKIPEMTESDFVDFIDRNLPV